jgi:hypothetical protein
VQYPIEGHGPYRAPTVAAGGRRIRALYPRHVRAPTGGRCQGEPDRGNVYVLWYQAYILWVGLVHQASAGVEMAYILFQNFINPPSASITAKQRSLILSIRKIKLFLSNLLLSLLYIDPKIIIRMLLIAIHPLNIVLYPVLNSLN